MESFKISSRSCGETVTKIRSAIDQLLDHRQFEWPTEFPERKLELRNSNGDAILGIQVSKEMPEHMSIMINGLNEHMRDFASAYIENLMIKGDLVVGTWVQNPPIVQHVDDDGQIYYHMEPMHIGIKP